MMTVATLGELADLVGGVVRGSREVTISHALPLERDLPSNCITLVDKAGAVSGLASSRAIAAVVPDTIPPMTLNAIVVTDPHWAFQKIIRHLRPPRAISPARIHRDARIHPTATLGTDCSIAPDVHIAAGCRLGDRVRLHGGVHIMSDCVIGDDCEIFPAVVLYPDTRMGARCVIHAGTVLGANGFGYRTVQGIHHPAGQLGWVELGDDVELGACVTIDRGTYGATRIGTGTKIDNQVMIGHNCQVGRHNLICAQAGIAGSSSTGDYVVLAGQAGLKDHVHLGDRVVVGAQAGVMHNLSEPGVWSGSPAMPIKKHMQTVALTMRLPELRSEVKMLQNEMQALREQLAALRAAPASTTPAAHASLDAQVPPSIGQTSVSAAQRAA